MISGLIGLAVAGGIAGFAAADDGQLAPADDVQLDDVRLLVARLGSSAREEREASEQALERRGPVILGELVRLAPLCTGESRLRLDRVISRLEAALVERSTEPSIVSLSVDDAPVRDVLARIARDSGNPIALADEVATGAAGLKPVTLSLDRVTYWEAIDEVLTRGGLDIDCLDDGKRVVVVPAATRTARRAAAGPLLVVATGVEVGRAAADGRSVRVGLRIVWEPRIVPLVIRLPMESVQVEGPQGESVPPSSRRAVLEATLLPHATWLPMTLPLVAEDPLPESLASVRATVRLWCAGGEHDFELPLNAIPAAVRQRMGQAEVSFRADAREAGRFRVEAEVVYDSPSEPLASHRMWLVDRELELVAGDGSRIAAATHRVGHRSDRGLAIVDEFAVEGPPPKGGRVRWRLPAAIREVPIDVMLRDVMR